MKTDLKKQPQGISYLIIGSGRLATHLFEYFKLLNINFEKWNRSQSHVELSEMLEKKPVVILAISDSALEPFFKEHLAKKSLTVVHCSGAFSSAKMISCHPLMTFGKDLYSLDAYKKIHFAVTGVSSIQEIFPAITNTSFELKAEDKPLYHALCVLSAAGAQSIWSQSQTLLSKLGIPESAFGPYINQIAQNYITSGSKALTGPWVRGDKKTISQNLNALAKTSDSLHKVYDILKEGSL
jgi:2-dehydropantoate 2-reductase